MKEYDQKCYRIAEAAFQRIADQFPTLKMEKDEKEPVEIYISIPVQPGLKYGAALMLQNRDELHFSVGNFHLEWVPCAQPSKVEAYIEAVTGFLRGQYRVLEHYRGNRYVKGELQALVSGINWETVGISRPLGPSFMGPKHTKELINSNEGDGCSPGGNQ
jgi:hypothetical protein